jgi:hypothetical protein
VDEYLKEVRHCQEHSGWRVGQCAFNVLVAMHPEVAEQVRGTSLDPFYSTSTKDERYVNFMDFVAENIG